MALVSWSVRLIQLFDYRKCITKFTGIQKMFDEITGNLLPLKINFFKKLSYYKMTRQLIIIA